MLSLSLAGFKDPALSKGLAQSNSNHDKCLLQTFTIFYIIHPFNDGALKKIDSFNAEVIMRKTGWENKLKSWNFKPPYNVEELTLILLKKSCSFYVQKTCISFFFTNVHICSSSVSSLPSLFPQFDCSTRISRCDVPSMIEARTLPAIHTQL